MGKPLMPKSTRVRDQVYDCNKGAPCKTYMGMHTLTLGAEMRIDCVYGWRLINGVGSEQMKWLMLILITWKLDKLVSRDSHCF